MLAGRDLTSPRESLLRLVRAGRFWRLLAKNRIYTKNTDFVILG